MRTEKFDSTKDNYKSDDIGYALEYNGVEGLTKGDIDVIVAEVCGANDELDWHWIIQRKDGKFQYVNGGCDYTGWDCQSSCEASPLFDTVEEALAAAPEKEQYGTRGIRRVLKGQIEETIPFACYQN